LPAERLVEQSAERRADHRHHGHAHRHIADHRGRAVLGHHVAHDGARQHHRHDDAGLHHAKGKKDRDGRREQAADRRDEEQPDPPQHHRAPPPAVRDRAHQQLQPGIHREIERHR
jgi:hypothetical protein